MLEEAYTRAMEMMMLPCTQLTKLSLALLKALYSSIHLIEFQEKRGDFILSNL
jgi:hypothetical protein